MRRPPVTAAAAALLALAGGPACEKVPFVDVNAGFAISDVAWFEEEETMFIFYEVSAEQGLGEPSLVEITYATDDERVDWSDIEAFDTVHTHLPVDCGVRRRCGSTSIHVPKEPREVDIRLRYHREGELSLRAQTVYNVVAAGPDHSNRSLLVYGVFDETNQRIQWRARHQFPTIRNEQAQELGLRRDFAVRDQRYGRGRLTSADNPYGYATGCPDGLTEAGLDAVSTDERAVFNRTDLPLDASDAPIVCAQATVTDALGDYTASALAQKNPQVRAGFPLLRSPIREAVPIRFFLAPCDRTISEDHEEMQRQRTQTEGTPTYCIDDWDRPTFVDALAADLSDAIEAARPDGEDMVLVIALHQDESGVSEAVEEALALVLPEERERSSPRVAGAFVLDSQERPVSLPELDPVVLWCPSELPTGGGDTLPSASLACAVLPDNPNFELGPFSFGQLPILPPRDQYLDFINEYSVRQAGLVEELTFRTPEFAVTSDHIPFGDFGVVTFLNGEQVSASPTDAFSFCAQEDAQFFAFRSPIMQSKLFQQLAEDNCDQIGLDPSICETAALGLLPIELLPQWHALLGEEIYDLGMFWEFPFLLRMQYQAVTAGSISAFGLTVPFGLGNPAEAYYGTQIWTEESFSLDPLLTQCRRFCGHPTFDSAGVYRISEPFRETYQTTCYTPDYPEPGDLGFPLDP